MTGRASLRADARQYLVDDVREVERLIEKMPPETQERYRETSKPHKKLAAFDALIAALEPFAAVGRELGDEVQDNILIAWRRGMPSLTVQPGDFHRAVEVLS